MILLPKGRRDHCGAHVRPTGQRLDPVSCLDLREPFEVNIVILWDLLMM